MVKVMHPQEIEVFYVLPALRSRIAKYLKESGVKSFEIAKKLGVTDAAVSQYITSKRGHDVEFSKDIEKAIEDAAKELMKGKDYRDVVMQLLKVIKSKKGTCKLCHRIANIPTKCDSCF